VVRRHPDTPQRAGMTRSGTCYRLVVAGRPSRLLVDTIDARFGSAALIRPSGDDTAVLLTADQPALRALLMLLWDVGHELVAVSAYTGGVTSNETGTR
jgi:hypothetical protein